MKAFYTLNTIKVSEPQNLSVVKTSDNLQICLSKPEDTRNWPSGWNLRPKTSPGCPVSSIIGANKFDVLGGPYTSQPNKPKPEYN